MSKSLLNKPLKMGLIQQNCFVRDVYVAPKFDPDIVTEYETIDEVVTQDGVKLVTKTLPYTITPQYVNSFVDSSDYRRDPATAVLNGVKRPNLGDIRDIQDITSMDTEQARSLYSQLQARFQSASSAATSTLQGEIAPPATDNKE